jgi:polysaccharide export outer membrane protein
MNCNFLKILFLVLLTLSLFSCKTAEKTLYFQGELSQQNIQLHEKFIPLIRINDLLEIKLTASNEEAVKMLTPEIPNARSTVTYSSGGVAKGGFLVNSLGEIELPFIGKFVVVNRGREQVENEIEKKLSEYIQDPIVQIQIINFKVTILGDVKTPGTYNVPNEKMTIIELVGIAGDLNISGKRKEVKIIREENGVLKEYNIDLTQKNIFNQNTYFLQQNDIIYVKPNRAKLSNANVSQIFLPVISTISIVLSAISILSK